MHFQIRQFRSRPAVDRRYRREVEGHELWRRRHCRPTILDETPDRGLNETVDFASTQLVRLIHHPLVALAYQVLFALRRGRALKV